MSDSFDDAPLWSERERDQAKEIESLRSRLAAVEKASDRYVKMTDAQLIDLQERDERREERLAAAEGLLGIAVRYVALLPAPWSKTVQQADLLKIRAFLSAAPAGDA